MAKKQLNASDVANKWAQGMSGAGQAYTQGTAAVQESPGVSALRNAQNYLNGVQRSYSDGTYQKGLQSFTLQDWSSACAAKGATRLGSGAQQAKGKMQSFFSGFIPALQSIQQTINAMPNGTFEERQAKSVAYQNATHQLKGQFRTK